MYGQHEGRPHQFLCGERQQLALERQEASKRAAMSLLRTQMPCSPLFGDWERWPLRAELQHHGCVATTLHIAVQGQRIDQAGLMTVQSRHVQEFWPLSVADTFER